MTARSSKQASKQASIAEIRLLQYVFGAFYLPLKYTCEMRAGKAIRASELSETEDNEHPYLCYGGNGVRGFIGKTNYRGGFPIIGRQGALCGNIQFADGEFYATEHAVVVSSKAYMTNDTFITYLLQ